MRKQLQRAFTLIEMLIAMALTLILVFAVAEFYAYVGTAVRDSRALIEMGGQLRAASQQLHDDLNSLTLRPEPWIDPASSPGYFTVYEGQQCDAYPDWYVDATATDIFADTAPMNQIPDAIEQQNITTLIGDGDDMLAMTIRAKDVPFQGQVWDSTRSQYVSTSSQYAEVIWYTTFDDLDGSGRWEINEPRYLCRRQLLILPNYNLQLPAGVSLAQFFQEAEVSFRVNSAGNIVANSLADLALRHNRYGCQLQNPPSYPSHMWINPTNAASLTRYSLGGTRFGEDRVLPNLLAFDVRVFDPTAPVHQDSSGTTALIPGDMGFGRNGSTQVGVGAWVDLSYERTLGAGAGNSHFSELPPAPFNIPAPTRANSATQPYNFNHWDTWPLSYEMPYLGLGPGFNGTGFPGTGRAFNGLDDPPGANGVDDPTERQTQPPYAAPLRGVQVRLRIYEPQTRQARQVTVGADFVAE